jgi:hypothetical protein
MLIRILNGACWAQAAHLGDYLFEEIPQVGHLLAIDDGGDWRCGSVLAVVHRVASAGEAADVAVLVGALVTGGVDDPLPLGLLDELSGQEGKGGAASPSRLGPWNR